MTRADNKRQLFFFVGLLSIIILYSLYNVWLVTAEYMDATSKWVRHVIRFVVFLVVYGMGVFAFRKRCPDWLMQIWHSLYALVAVLLVLMGILGWFTGIPPFLLHMGTSLYEFLISPVPYVVMAIINRKMAPTTTG